MRCLKCGYWTEKRPLFNTYYDHCDRCDAAPPPEKENNNPWTNRSSTTPQGELSQVPGSFFGNRISTLTTGCILVGGFLFNLKEIRLGEIRGGRHGWIGSFEFTPRGQGHRTAIVLAQLDDPKVELHFQKWIDDMKHRGQL